MKKETLRRLDELATTRLSSYGGDKDHSEERTEKEYEEDVIKTKETLSEVYDDMFNEMMTTKMRDVPVGVVTYFFWQIATDKILFGVPICGRLVADGKFTPKELADSLLDTFKEKEYEKDIAQYENMGSPDRVDLLVKKNFKK